jgi:hypothetical protein
MLDAVDLLFERCRDSIADDFGRCAGVARVDDDRRRSDLGILRDRQGEIRGGADQCHKHRQHGRKDRPVDKKMRQVHRPARAQWLPAEAILPGCGVTLLPGRARHQPIDDNLVVQVQPGTDDPQSIVGNRAGPHDLGDDGAIGTHGHHHFSRLVCDERRVGHEDRLVLLRARDADAAELAGRRLPRLIASSSEICRRLKRVGLADSGASPAF